MRKFGSEAKEYLSFQIEGSDEIYKIPLAGSMAVSMLLKIHEADENDGGLRAQIEVLRHFMGDVVDDLSAGTLGDILHAWADASRGQGAEVGES